MIPVNTPVLVGNEKKYLAECIDSGWISSEGPFIERFESALASYVDRKHAIAVSNGSAALEVALAALKIGPGDEVIVPTFTIISCVSAIVRAGAIPVLVDCNDDDWNMSSSEIESVITDKTRAIMMIHIYGLPADVDSILAIANRHNLFVIEDAAEMLGQTYMDKPCGSFGDISTFSFYPNKLVTTGEGGMVLTNDDNLAERCRLLMNLCFQPNKRFVHEELGWNFRMSNMQAAVGLAQFENIDISIRKKRETGQIYQQLLADIEGVVLALPKNNFATNIYWVFGIVINNSTINKTAQDVMAMMSEQKIGTRPFFWPMHEQPVFTNSGIFNDKKYPVAERIARQGLYIPSGLGITESEQHQVASALKQILN